MRPPRHIIAIAGVVATFIANAGEQLAAKAEGAVQQPTAADLQLLQGTWEGVVVSDKGSSPNSDLPKAGERKPYEIGPDFLSAGVLGKPQPSPEKITITIAGNSLHFHRDTNFWFKTTIALTAGTDPRRLQATIKSCPPSQSDSIGKVVGAIFKIEDGTLTLAEYAMSDDPPKSFAGVTSRYVVQKVQPQPKNPEPSKTK